MDNFYYVPVIFIQTTLQPKIESPFYCYFFDTVYHSIPFTHVVCHSKPSFNTILRNSPTKEFFATKIWRITYKINEFSADMYFKLFTISKKKNKYNRLYLRMILILSGDIELNPGPVDRKQIIKEDFEVFNNKGIHFMHLIINFLIKQTNWCIIVERRIFIKK